MSDEDIIELGADGSFDLPSTTVEKKKNPIDIPVETHPTPSVSQNSAENAKNEDLLNNIPVGEYKVFKYDDKVDLIMHLDDQSKWVSSVKVIGGTVKITTAENSTISVDISNVVGDTKKQAKAFKYKEFMTIRFEV